MIAHCCFHKLLALYVYRMILSLCELNCKHVHNLTDVTEFTRTPKRPSELLARRFFTHARLLHCANKSCGLLVPRPKTNFEYFLPFPLLVPQLHSYVPLRYHQCCAHSRHVVGTYVTYQLSFYVATAIDKHFFRICPVARTFSTGTQRIHLLDPARRVLIRVKRLFSSMNHVSEAVLSHYHGMCYLHYLGQKQ